VTHNVYRILIGLMVLALTATSAPAAPKGGLSQSFVQELMAQKLNGTKKAVADIVANQNIKDVALNRERFIEHNSLVDFKIKSGDITNQKSSGRCWMFAGFNALRPQVIKKYNLKKFEFSENYLMFWDKMEKSNMFLQYMIEFADRPLDDRELEIVLDSPIGDGGWWSYFVDLVNKYGLVPKEIMPETFNSSSSGMMNKLITMKLKQFGLELRQMVRDRAQEDAVDNRKKEMMAEIYRMLVMNLGEPPTEFKWRYETDDSTGIVENQEKFTPQSFYKEVLGSGLEKYVALFNYAGKDYYENYSLRLSRNMYDRPNFTILNLPIDTIRAYALKSVLDSTPVWFACDVGQDNYGKDGIMALDIYNYGDIYNTAFDLPKADLIHMQLITPNHAMTFVGVDTANGQANKWLVENSWGDDKGDKGFWYMYNGWFDRYLFGIIIDSSYLSKDLQKTLKKSPVELPPWDPMYSLNKMQ
jgi:bleomycin hydrolase